MANDIVGQIPKDASGVAFERAMAVPIVKDSIVLGSSSKWVDIYDLTAWAYRAFIGISIYNPDNTKKIKVALTDEFGTDHCITVQESGMFTLDNQSFGPGFSDESLGKAITRIRAKLSADSGTFSSMTIDYDNGGAPIQPTNGMCVKINGIVYEFSDDASVAPGRQKVVIGANADASWTALKDKINAVEQSVTVTIDTGTNILTVTSNYGGASAIATLDGDEAAANTTGAVFSGAATSGGANGITPIFHIW